MKRLLVIPLFLLPFTSHALEPWFTGPAIAISGKTVAKGKIAVQPYATYRDAYGAFNNQGKKVNTIDTHASGYEQLVFYGLTDWMDIQGLFAVSQQYQLNKMSSELGDTRVLTGIQLLKGELHSWKPFIKLLFAQFIPTGKYQNLSPLHLGLDANGAGAYSRWIGFVVHKYIQFKNEHYLSTRVQVNYRTAETTAVSGFNSYGGGYQTQGKVKVGYGFQADWAIEYQLTQKWVGVLEFNYRYNDQSRFYGFPGFDAFGKVANIGSNNQYTFSFLPGIEYNFGPNVGILFSLWMSVKGKNAANYMTGVTTVYATLG
ncbi:hypothetical protein [Legionella shakespearei]|uniref:Fe-S protein n=1 Tax=Legionella shakespearei DSM 23087 TaxID=1122169 RepID=A0A0W0YM86_9GAMM|nr:hypothetical protein [Legionella shakespearei]KTD57699.1 Fe-S protein [Legionella shakespearei DSM 23087]